MLIAMFVIDMPGGLALRAGFYGALFAATKLGLDPTLMAAANSSGGVMGKMIDAQSMVVASVATNYQGKEGVILRFVFWHSIALAASVACRCAHMINMERTMGYASSRVVAREERGGR